MSESRKLVRLLSLKKSKNINDIELNSKKKKTRNKNRK